MATETVGAVSMRESIQGALAEQSGKSDQAEDTGSEARQTQTDETKAAATSQPQDTAKAPGAADASAGEEESLPGVDLSQLPPEIRKQVNKILTPKFQELAAGRKEVERLKQFGPLIDAFEAEPEKVLTALAREQGFTLTKAEAREVIREAKADGGGGDAALATLTELFGEEATAKLAPVFNALVQAQLGPMTERLTAHEARLKEQEVSAIAAETESDLKAFGASHKDFPQHEKAMFEWSQKVLPGADVSASEYLETLYQLAKAGAGDAEKTKNVILRMTSSAAAAESANAGVPSNKVAPVPEGPIDARTAIQMALRGEEVPQ